MSEVTGLARVRIRSAEASDAEAISQIHVDSTLDAYSGILPSASIEIHTYESRLRQWRARLAQSPEATRSVTLVAEIEGEVMGFIDARPGRSALGDDLLETEVAEVTTIYVDSSMWRHGLGAELMHACARGLAASGFAEAYLYVFADNIRACQFYEALGWARSGEQRSGANDAPVEACYRLQLRSAESPGKEGK